MKGGKGETLALVLPKEFALLQPDVMHLIGWASPVGSVPLVCWTHTAVSVTDRVDWFSIRGKIVPLNYVILSKWFSIGVTSEDSPFKVLTVTSYIAFRAANQHFNQHANVPKDKMEKRVPDLHIFHTVKRTAFISGGYSFICEGKRGGNNKDGCGGGVTVGGLWQAIF